MFSQLGAYYQNFQKENPRNVYIVIRSSSTILCSEIMVFTEVTAVVNDVIEVKENKKTGKNVRQEKQD